MQIMNAVSLALHRQQLNEVASPDQAGQAFDGFTRRLIAMSESNPDAPSLFVGFGKTMFGMTASGETAYVVTADASEDGGVGKQEEVTATARGWHVPAIGDGLYESTLHGSVPTNKMIGDVRIASGVVLIVGKASTAKTPFAHALASAGGGDYAIVRYGEPLAGYCLDMDELSRDIGQAMLGHRDIVLDSVKDVLAFAAGGAMSSGIQRGAFPILSDLSALAAERGCTIYVPLNPSNPDPKTVDMLVEAARSNVASVVIGEPGATPDVVQWTFFTRRGEGLIRETSSMASVFKKGDLTMTITAASAATSSRSLSSPAFSNATDSPRKGQAVDELMQAALHNFTKGLK